MTATSDVVLEVDGGKASNALDLQGLGAGLVFGRVLVSFADL